VGGRTASYGTGGATGCLHFGNVGMMSRCNQSSDSQVTFPLIFRGRFGK